MIEFLLGVMIAQSGQIRETDINVGGAADVRGYRRGVDALFYDPAAPAFADGFELQYRQRIADRERSSFGIQAVLPGTLTLGAGYNWFPSGAARLERGVLNLALRQGPIAIGASYQRFRSSVETFDDQGLWSLGVFGEASSWLSWSAGVDAVNSPAIFGERQRFAYRLGASVRPVSGAPWLTLGGETRFDGADLEWGRTRAVAEFALRDLAGFLAYDFNQEEAWLGVSFALGGVGIRSSGGASTQDGASDDFAGALALTLRSNPEGPALVQSSKHVEIVLRGDLRGSDGFLRGRELVSSVPLKLERLARDPTVRRVTMVIGGVSIGTADVQALRRGIHQLRAAGKRVEAEVGYVDDRAYMIAAACNEIRVDPTALLEVNGFAITRRYYAATLAKLGVRVSASAIGDYKSGPHPYTRTESTRQEDKVTNEILTQFYDELVRVLVEDRGKTEAQAKMLVDRGLFTAREALEAGLVDGLTFPEDSETVPAPRPRGISVASIPAPGRRWGTPPTIEVIPVIGAIAQTQSNPLVGEHGSAQSIVPRLEAALRDSDVDAVVLYINSPGGEVGASDRIWRAVKRLAARKPVITFMGNVAASGGYWIATATDTIIAEPGTITGSIGIFQLKVDIEALYRMLDVTTKIDKRGILADIRTETRAPNAEELQRVREVLDQQYDRFIEKVAVGRRMSRTRVREIAGGRVYTGQRALQLGLVDEVSGFVRAVELAAERAGLANGTYSVRIAKSSTQLDRAVRSVLATGGAPDLIDMVGRSFDRWRMLERQSMAILPLEYSID